MMYLKQYLCCRLSLQSLINWVKPTPIPFLSRWVLLRALFFASENIKFGIYSLLCVIISLLIMFKYCCDFFCAQNRWLVTLHRMHPNWWSAREFDLYPRFITLRMERRWMLWMVLMRRQLKLLSRSIHKKWEIIGSPFKWCGKLYIPLKGTFSERVGM